MNVYEGLSIDEEDDCYITHVESHRAAEEECLAEVAAVFPDICSQYLKEIVQIAQYDAAGIINTIIDREEDGKPYRRQQKGNALKRKRDAEVDADEDVMTAVRHKYSKRVHTKPHEFTQDQKKRVLKMFADDFPTESSRKLQEALCKHRWSLFATYLSLHREFFQQLGITNNDREWRFTKGQMISEDEQFLKNSNDPTEREMYQEIQDARGFCSAAVTRRKSQISKKEDEERNFEHAKANGTAGECECCFGEFADNRLIHCEATEPHFFCIFCARKQAETLVGTSRYELNCMSMENCSATFSHVQRNKFLDEKLSTALDRIEQEAILRIANLKDLEKCPFCPFAAEYPPVEEDREFRCLNPGCEFVSCRLCKMESHIPKSCAEAAEERGGSARRHIEEAMSGALIRKCNKCGVPFIKDHGCNKMTCPQMGCGNIQCYVCSQSCNYTHFNDEQRGGKSGNCPLYDNSEVRHAKEVQQAEEKTRKQIAEENPDLDPKLLNIEVSQAVAEDDANRSKDLEAYVERVGQPPGMMRRRVVRRPPVNLRTVRAFNRAQVPEVAPGVVFQAQHPAVTRRWRAHVVQRQHPNHEAPAPQPVGLFGMNDGAIFQDFGRQQVAPLPVHLQPQFGPWGGQPRLQVNGAFMEDVHMPQHQQQRPGICAGGCINPQQLQQPGFCGHNGPINAPFHPQEQDVKRLIEENRRNLAAANVNARINGAAGANQYNGIDGAEPQWDDQWFLPPGYHL